MKHIKRDFRLKVLGGLRGSGQKVNIQLFQNMVSCIANLRESRIQQHGSK